MPFVLWVRSAFWGRERRAMPNSLSNLAFTFAARAVGKWYGIALTYDVSTHISKEYLPTIGRQIGSN
ncbi:MAG: hypothetical protein RM368_34400 [Nostoc sp. DedSLP03]|nr:hypothetical protein [Nostoc sp. DedSLP03]